MLAKLVTLGLINLNVRSIRKIRGQQDYWDVRHISDLRIIRVTGMLEILAKSGILGLLGC